MVAYSRSDNRFALPDLPKAMALVLAFAVAFALSAFAVLAFSAPAHAATAGAYVSGQKVGSGSKFVVKSGTATWGVDSANANGRVITLTNAVIEPGSKDTGTGHGTGIFVTPDFDQASKLGPIDTLTIKLVGDNTINLSGDARGIENMCERVTLNITGSGTLDIEGAGQFGIYSKGPIVIGANVHINGSPHGIFAASTLRVTGSNLGVTGAYRFAVYSKGQQDVNAHIMVSDSRYGLYSEQDLNVNGGLVLVQDPQNNGLTSLYGDVNIRDGEVDAMNYDGCGIQAAAGSVNITGGSVSATQKAGGTPNYAVAVGSNGAINNSTAPQCWETIRGRLDNGATFVKSGSTYKVQTTNNTYVTLVKYGSTKTKPSINKVTFGEENYNVKTIGSKAFYKNKKIKSVKFGSFITKINSKAFYGCKNLKTIDFRKISYPASLKVNTKAFTKAYKTPTVKVVNSAAKTYVKKQLKKRGLKYAKYRVGR